MKRRAVYAGTFDPITIGHLWMVKQGSIMFDELIVSVGVNPEKDCLFPIDDRLDMLRKSVDQFSNVSVSSYINKYLIFYAQSVGAQFILRGIREERDYQNERELRNINGDLGPEITTIFLMPPRELVEVSSHMVKNLVGPDGWEEVVQKYVTFPVFEKFKKMHSAK